MATKNLLTGTIHTNAKFYRYSQTENEIGPTLEINGHYAAASVPAYRNNAAVSISLPYGERIIGRVISPHYEATEKSYGYQFGVYSEANLMSGYSYSIALKYMTLTREEFGKLVYNNDFTRVDYNLRVLLSDDLYGRGGWTSHAIAADLGLLISENIQGVYINCPNYWIQAFEMPVGSTFLDAIKELFGMFEPRIEYDGENLYILDRGVNSGSFGQLTILDSCEVSQDEPYSPKPKYVTVIGQDGEFIAANYKGQIVLTDPTLVNISPFGLSCNCGYTYGDPGYEIIETTKTEPFKVDDEKQGFMADASGATESSIVYVKELSIDYYLKNIFSKNAEKYYSIKLIFKRVDSNPVLPPYTVGTYYTDPSVFACDYLYQQTVEVNVWGYTGANYEKGRLVSCNDNGLDYWGDVGQPHTIKVDGQYCWTQNYDSEGTITNNCEFFAISKVTLTGTYYTDEYDLTGEENTIIEGVPFYKGQIIYAPCISSGIVSESDYKFKKYALFDLTSKNIPVGGYIYPMDENNMPIAAESMTLDDVIINDCIVEEKVERISNLRWDQYDKDIFHRKLDKEDGDWQLLDMGTSHISSPPPQAKLEKLKMRVYAEDDIVSEVVSTPSVVVNTEMVDWDDVAFAQMRIKNRLRRGHLFRTYKFPLEIPADIGQSVVLSEISGPDGQIIYQPNSYINSRIINVSVERDAVSGRANTTIGVECEVVT